MYIMIIYYFADRGRSAERRRRSRSRTVMLPASEAVATRTVIRRRQLVILPLPRAATRLERRSRMGRQKLGNPSPRR